MASASHKTHPVKMGSASYPADHLLCNWYSMRARTGGWTYTLMDAIEEKDGIGLKEARVIVKKSGGSPRAIKNSEMFSVGSRVRLTLYGRAVYAARKLGIRKQSLMILSYIYIKCRKTGYFIRSLEDFEGKYSIQISDDIFRKCFSELMQRGLVMKGSFRRYWVIRDTDAVDEHGSVLEDIFNKMCK